MTIARSGDMCGVRRDVLTVAVRLRTALRFAGDGTAMSSSSSGRGHSLASMCMFEARGGSARGCVLAAAYNCTLREPGLCDHFTEKAHRWPVGHSDCNSRDADA